MIENFDYSDLDKYPEAAWICPVGTCRTIRVHLDVTGAECPRCGASMRRATWRDISHDFNAKLDALAWELRQVSRIKAVLEGACVHGWALKDSIEALARTTDDISDLDHPDYELSPLVARLRAVEAGLDKLASARCDGEHAALPCADLKCWHREPSHGDPRGYRDVRQCGDPLYTVHPTGVRICLVCEVRRLATENATLLKEKASAEARLRAYIGSVEEMSLGVGLPNCFVVQGPDGKQTAVPPEKGGEFYRAIKHKWQRDEAALVEFYEKAQHAYIERPALLKRIEELEKALSKGGA